MIPLTPPPVFQPNDAPRVDYEERILSGAPLTDLILESRSCGRLDALRKVIYHQLPIFQVLFDMLVENASSSLSA